MDIKIEWNPATAQGDWVIADSDVALDNPLRTAVMISLFTDQVAPAQPTADDAAVGIAALPAGADRRGWWGDAYSDGPTNIGSRLWQMRRMIKAGDTAGLAEVRDVCSSALQWLVTDQVVASVTVTAAWVAKTAIQFLISLTMPDGTKQKFDFSWAWEGLT